MYSSTVGRYNASTMPAHVDVRDMLCAQALAVVARAMARLRAGETLTVMQNTDDVRHDLLVWARAHGYPTHEETGTIRMTAHG